MTVIPGNEGVKGSPLHTRTDAHTPSHYPQSEVPQVAFSTSCDLVFSSKLGTEPFKERRLRCRPAHPSNLCSFPGKRLSSTPLEILFFLNGWYYATYFLLELFIFLYKGKAWGLTTLAPTSLPHVRPEPTPIKSLLFCSSSSLLHSMASSRMIH